MRGRAGAARLSRAAVRFASSSGDAVTPASRNELSRPEQARMLRVDHAGEYGAVRIYQGQLAALGRTSERPKLEEMAEHEREHLRSFEQILPQRRVRPTALLPIWDVAGFALGALSGLAGINAAHRVTAAVEDVISNHYDKQAKEARFAGDTALAETFEKFRDDELEHKSTAEDSGALQSPVPRAVDAVVKRGCRYAIWASERM